MDDQYLAPLIRNVCPEIYCSPSRLTVSWQASEAVLIVAITHLWCSKIHPWSQTEAWTCQNPRSIWSCAHSSAKRETGMVDCGHKQDQVLVQPFAAQSVMEAGRCSKTLSAENVTSARVGEQRAATEPQPLRWSQMLLIWSFQSGHEGQI